jgi:NAD(P)-dependent dehydrogenase (short-subunit alcohol dehydrogenase family)
MKLEGKVAIVTGGGAGIGEGIAICLAEEGADVAVIDISKERADAVAAKVKAAGRKSLAIVANCMDAKDVNQSVKKVFDTFGKIDILVTNVGGEARFYKGWTGNRFTEIIKDEWDENIELNLKSNILACQAVAPYLIKQKHGKIVNIASTAGRTPSAMGGSPSAILMPYSVCKAGVIRFTQALALELAEYGINVNAVCPSMVWSPMTEKNMLRQMQGKPEFAGMTAREYFDKFVVPRKPLKIDTTPEDIGKAVVFFVSEDSKSISGQSINVDGGARPS